MTNCAELVEFRQLLIIYILWLHYTCSNQSSSAGKTKNNKKQQLLGWNF